MSVNYNRLLGDGRCLQATWLGTAEKTFGEPGAGGPLVPGHNDIRKQPHFLASSSFQVFS